MSKKSLQNICAAASQPYNHLADCTQPDHAEFQRLISILRDLVNAGSTDGLKLNWHWLQASWQTPDQ